VTRSLGRWARHRRDVHKVWPGLRCVSTLWLDDPTRKACGETADVAVLNTMLDRWDPMCAQHGEIVIRSRINGGL
jgi:hypothetical protein